MSLHPPQRTRGAAIITMYWVIALLSLLVFGSMQLLFTDLFTQATQGERNRAFQLAEMGLAVAAHPQVERSDAILTQQFRNGQESFQARMESEGSRLNLNSVLQNNDVELLYRLFEIWGLPRERSSPVIESLLDWVDSDDLKRLNGAEERDYLEAGRAGLPANKIFASMHEVYDVLGIEILFQIRPDWLDTFTLYSDGMLALEDANAEVLSAALGTSLVESQDWVASRKGRDGIEHTEDDFRLETVDAVLAQLNLGGPDPDIVTGLTVRSNILRLSALGRVGPVTVERWIVVQGRGPGMRVLSTKSRLLPRQSLPSS